VKIHLQVLHYLKFLFSLQIEFSKMYVMELIMGLRLKYIAMALLIMILIQSLIEA
jgi:hypothetical protein